MSVYCNIYKRLLLLICLLICESKYIFQLLLTAHFLFMVLRVKFMSFSLSFILPTNLFIYFCEIILESVNSLYTENLAGWLTPHATTLMLPNNNHTWWDYFLCCLGVCILFHCVSQKNFLLPIFIKKTNCLGLFEFLFHSKLIS